MNNQCESVGRLTPSTASVREDVAQSLDKRKGCDMTTGSTSKSQISGAVKLAILASSMPLLSAFPSTAMAQSGGTSSAETDLEEIIVTGSRIKRSDIDSASPVSVLDREAIVTTGITDVGNIVQRMPSMSGSPIGTTTNNGGNGSVQIDLRGLGVNRTLTLVNGRRVVDRGDYQTIPVEMIERVEILKDGASAIYGADAVAGVVNIITRRDFEGLSLNVQHADFFDMESGNQQSFGLIAGKTFDGGNLVFGAEYVDQEQAFQSDAPWEFFQDSYVIFPEGGCERQLTDPFDGTPTGGCLPAGSSRIPEGLLRFADTQEEFMNVDGSGLTPFDDRSYNYAPVNYIQTPYKRTNLFAETNFEISENVRFSAALRGNMRTSAQELAPLPYDSRPGFDPGYVGQFNGVQYNGISEDNFYLVQAAAAAGLAPAAVDQVRRRMVETNRRFEQDVTQWQTNLSLDGTIDGLGSLEALAWDVYYSRGRRSRTDVDLGQFFGPSLANAMGPSADLDGDGNPECYTDINDPASLIPDCVPMNFFGGPGSVTQEMLDYVGIDLVDTRVTNLEEVGLGISGTAFELAGGDFGWAAGVAYRRDSFTYAPDSGKQQNQVTGSVGLGTDGSLYSRAIYAEFLAPVFDNGTQAIDLTGGIRYDDYNLFGADTTWQIGVEFQALESLKLRATAGTVFRAPTITELFQGFSDSAPTYSDPCIPPEGQALPPGCAQVGVQTDNQLPAKVGGSPDLIPETGDTFTAGLVWTPAFSDGGLSLTVDYWQVEIEDGISSLGAQFILEDCYIRQNADSCSRITRTVDYNISQLVDTNVNVADQGASGVDTELRYSFETSFGEFETSLLWAYLIERTKTPNEFSAEIGLGGRYTNPTAEDGGAYARNKVNYSIQWHRDGLSIAYLGEYIHDLVADTQFCCRSGAIYVHDVDSQLYHDLVGSYSFSQGTTVSAGITNLTDEEPPFIDSGFNASTDPATYRLFGRGYYLRLSHDFE